MITTGWSEYLNILPKGGVVYFKSWLILTNLKPNPFINLLDWEEDWWGLDTYFKNK